MRKNNKEKELKKFPNGEAISNWFFDNEIVGIGKLGKTYSVLDFDIKLNALMTNEIQNLINHISSNGGGVLYFPKGTYLSGAVYLKDKVSLYLEEGAVIYGSENIDDFPLTKTRIEGECCEYYPALINVINTSNTYIFGKGEINGNGLPYWKKFWEDQKRNPKSTNKDTHRPRLLFANECDNLTIDGITFKDSPFWTTHYYKCNNLKITNCQFLSPKEPVPAPSTDGIDIDVCENVVIDNCYFEVNDDAIALKGGKGPYADMDVNNGKNKNIIIRNCRFGHREHRVWNHNVSHKIPRDISSPSDPPPVRTIPHNPCRSIYPFQYHGNRIHKHVFHRCAQTLWAPRRERAPRGACRDLRL